MHFEDFFQAATGAAPYAHQRAFAANPIFPDLLEAPTGSGKTATAVLGWLWRRLHGTPEQRAEARHRLVGLLLCRSRDQVQVEYALRDMAKPIGVAEWETQIAKKLPEELKGSLPTAEEIEAELGARGVR